MCRVACMHWLHAAGAAWHGGIHPLRLVLPHGAEMARACARTRAPACGKACQALPEAAARQRQHALI